MHGGTELIIVCEKSMREDEATVFVRSTDPELLARSLQTDREDHLDGYGEIVHGIDEKRGAHYVEIRFILEIEDLKNAEDWCLANGFQITDSQFRSRG